MNKGKFALMMLFSCVFSACVTAGRRITFGGDVILKYGETAIRPFVISDLLVFVLTAAAAAAVLLLARRAADHRLSRSAEMKCEKKYGRRALIFAAVLLAAWLPYILTVAPGNIYLDSLESISQMLERGHPTSNHHPMFYTLMIGVFMKIGTVCFGSVNIGIFISSLFQTAVMIFCMVCVLLMMESRRAPRLMTGAALAYFMFMPYFPGYAMSLWKDVLFSCMLLLLSLLLYVLGEQDKAGKKWYILYGLVGISAMAFRNNGLYVFVGASVLAAILLRRHAKRLLLTTAAAATAFSLAASLATYVWDIHGDFVENLGVPLQQLGYTIKQDGEFSDEDREYLYTLMPDHVWGYAYRPCLVDTIKWNPYFDTQFLMETKGEFFSVWLRGLIKNPGKYIDGYLLATHGFWKPFVQNLYGYMDVQMHRNPYGIGFMDIFGKIFGFSLMEILKDYPVIMGSGTLLWLCLFGMTLIWMRKREGIAAYLPAMLNWATVMIATPVAFSLRYVYIFAIGLPFFIAIPFMTRGVKSKEALDSPF